MAKKAKKPRKGASVDVPCPRCGVRAIWISGGVGKADTIELPVDFDQCPRMNAMMTFDEDFDLLEYECETLMDEISKKTRF
jgi:hypothetical protein